jgi:diguanylate cyclase (GGDEF)-like protein
MNAFRRWLRSSMQAATLLGLIMIALVWTGVVFHLRVEHEKSYQAAVQDTGNLARVFEEHIVRVFNESDRAIRLFRAEYQRDPNRFDLRQWVANPLVRSDLAVQMSLIGADGYLVATSVDPNSPRIYLGDREHFAAHLDTRGDELFISRPLLGRASGKWSLQLSRAVRNDAGLLLGVIVLSLDPARLSELYKSVDLGRDGAINLIGTDGIVRAFAGFRTDVLGKSLAGAQLMTLVREKSAGSFITKGGMDGIPRVVSYRVVRDYPLMLYVGRAEHEVFADYARRQRSYYAIAGGVSLLILVVMGIAARHRARLDGAQRAVRKSEARALGKSRELEVTLDHMGQGIMMVDANDDVAVINRRAVELLDLPPVFLTSRPKFDQIMSHLWSQEEYGRDGELLDTKTLDRVRAGARGDQNFVMERTRPNGTVLEVRSAGLPGGGMVRTFTDVTVRRKDIERIAHMARYDALTGLSNRAHLHERMDDSLERLQRYNEPFAVFCLDLDRFKAVNDSLGHVAGDLLLKMVAKRLKNCVRATDTVARPGGDEFVVVVKATDQFADIANLAQRIVDALSATFNLDGQEANVGTSIGIAMAPYDGTNAAELVRKADLALYRVKAEGRNGFRFFEDEMEARVQARRSLERELRKALASGEFVLRYQLSYDIGAKKVCAVRAELRWNHPQRGLLGPTEFVDFAEEIGLIEQIREWALRQACIDAAAWPRGIKVAVNISAGQLKRRRLVSFVTGILALTGLDPHRLELEVPEAVFRDAGPEHVSVLRELQGLDIGVVLGDFGSGYASLNFLQSFRFSKIKIGEALVHQLGDNQACAAIVVAIVGLARNLGATTAAEGVDTEEQIDLLSIAGCNQAQGMFFGAIRTADEVGAILVKPANAPNMVA